MTEDPCGPLATIRSEKSKRNKAHRRRRRHRLRSNLYYIYAKVYLFGLDLFSIWLKLHIRFFPAFLHRSWVMCVCTTY